MTVTIGRRELLAALGSAAAAWPMAARAQQGERVRRLGILMNGAETDPLSQGYVAAFQQGLRALGWSNGKNLQTDIRWTSGDPERTRLYAPELVGLAPDVILCVSSSNLAALQRATPSLPIVFTLVSDPIAQGFVASLARPGGNITGFTAYESSIGGKWIDLLKQIAPELGRVAVLFNPDVSIQSRLYLRSVEAAAPSFGVEVSVNRVRSTEEIEPVVAAVSQQRNAGLIIPTDAFLTVRRHLVVELAARYRVPAIYPQYEYVAAGGLMYYGIDFNDQFRQAAVYVDRILRGGKPADLPIHQPMKFRLVINLKAARDLGIEVPMGLMLRTDEVTE